MLKYIPKQRETTSTKIYHVPNKNIENFLTSPPTNPKEPSPTIESNIKINPSSSFVYLNLFLLSDDCFFFLAI